MLGFFKKIGKFMADPGERRKITNSFLAGLMIFSGLGPGSPSIQDSEPAVEEDTGPVAAGGIFGFRKLLAEDGVVLEDGVLHDFLSSHSTMESFERIYSLSGYDASEQTDVSKNKDGSVIAVFDPDTKKGGIWSSFSTIYLNPSDYHFSSSSLKNIDLTGFNASKLPDISGWFSGCYNLEQVNLSGVDASNATGMNSAFANLSALKTVDMSGMNIRSVESMDSIFARDKTLTSVAFSDVDARSLTRMRSVFSNADSLKLVDFSGADLSSVTDMSGMFSDSGFERMPEIKTDKVKIGTNVDMSRMFERCSKLTEVDFSGRSFLAAATLDGVFQSCSSLVSVNFSGVDISNAIALGYPFYGCSNLKSVNMSGIKAGKVIDFDNRAFGGTILETVDLSNADFRNLESMQNMFNGQSHLKTVNLSGMRLGKTNMSNMFGSSSVSFVDMSGMDASMVTDMSYMFISCDNLASVKCTNMKIRDLENVNMMFGNCSNLSALDLSSWEGEEISDFSGMFQYCSNLISVDISGLNTSKAVYMRQMFCEDPKLAEIYVGPEWSTDSVTSSDNMFVNDANLPNYSVKHSPFDKTYATTDPDTGYLTFKDHLKRSDMMDLQYLANSSFILSGTSDYGTQVSAVVPSDKNGMLSFKNLEKGTYTLTEISPTDGYIKNSVKYTVTVTDSGVSVVPDNADFYYETEKQKVLFNEPYHSLMIQKTGSYNYGIAGAEFLLSGVSDYGTEVNQLQTTGIKGIAVFDHLESGSYLLTEAKAPKHYALDPISRIVTIDKYGDVQIDGLSKKGSSFVWTDIPSANKTITITKNWKDTLTGTAAANRALPSIVISDQRTIPDAVTVTYHAGDGYFGTDQTKKTNTVTYTEKVDGNSNILSASVSKGKELIPSMTGKMFDAWYLDSAFTSKAPDAIADYIKANSKEKELVLYAKYKDLPSEVTITYYAGDGYFGTDQTKKTNAVTYTEKADGKGNILSVSVSKGQELIPSMTGKMFDAWYLDFAFTNKAPDIIADYIKANSNEKELALYAKYKDVPIMTTSMLTTGQNFNAAIKTLAAGASKKYSDWDSSIKAVQVAEAVPSDASTMDVSAGGDGSYLAWWDADTSAIKLHSKSGSIVLNPDSSSMFYGCSELATLDVSKWNTSQVTNMSEMFESCSSLTTLGVSGWNTNKVTDMSFMFSDCTSLTTLDVSKWKTSQVTNMSGMFSYSNNLTTLDVSKWDTSKVTDMSGMFFSCMKLTTLGVSTLNTGSVTNMYGMFRSCSSLTTLDVSKWDTSRVTNMGSMFGGSSGLERIYIGSGWNTDNVTSSGYMFAGCSKLPNYNSSVVDKTNAHAGSGGYMMLKS